MANWPYAPGPEPELPDEDEAAHQAYESWWSVPSPVPAPSPSQLLDELLAACGYTPEYVTVPVPLPPRGPCRHERLLTSVPCPGVEIRRCLDCNLAGLSLQIALGEALDGDDD